MTKVGKIARLGQRACEFLLEDDATVNDLVAAANETIVKGETFSVAGETVKGSYNFDNGDLVEISPSTSGA